jgi:STE24 endopeptidase
MSSLNILIIYISFFTAEFLFENTLTILNLRNVFRYKGRVPDYFRVHITDEKYLQSVNYTVSKNRLALVSSLVSSFFLIIVVLSGIFGIADEWLAAFTGSLYIQGILYVFLLSFAFQLVSLPLELYSQFVIEERFGFNKMTLRLFFMDRLKSLLMSAVVGVPLLLGLFWFMERTGDLWWIFAVAFVTVVELLIMVIYPLVIAPLFNKFKPLEDGPLKDKLSSLSQRLDFQAQGIFVMDGSRRSKHANAYFTGIGKSKRIVLFDTLINLLSESQIEAVLAHEIGHKKKRHIIKRAIISLVLLAVIFWVLSLLLPFLALYQAFGFTRISYHGILIILSLCSGPFTFFLAPAFTAWSRRHEYAADKFAVVSGGVESAELINALIVLGRENLTNLTPHPLYSFYHYSHPTLPERIDALGKLQQASEKEI